VREAVAAGNFSIYAVDTVDDGIELLTGLTAGQRDAAGLFATGSINRRVEDRLADYSGKLRAFTARGTGPDVAHDTGAS
jgi:hypothetical protein